MVEEKENYWSKSDAPISGFMRLILDKKKKGKTMSDKKGFKLGFGRKTSMDPDKEPGLSLDEKLSKIQKVNVVSSEDAVVIPDKIVETQQPVKNEVVKPADISSEIQAIIQAYKGDLVKVQDFILSNFEGEDLYTAGFQICLILINERIIRENALREIFENMMNGRLTVPFDPREDPTIIMLLKKIIPNSFSKEVSEPVHVEEVYVDRKKQRLDEIHRMIDNEEKKK